MRLALGLLAWGITTVTVMAAKEMVSIQYESNNTRKIHCALCISTTIDSNMNDTFSGRYDKGKAHWQRDDARAHDEARVDCVSTCAFRAASATVAAAVQPLTTINTTFITTTVLDMACAAAAPEARDDVPADQLQIGAADDGATAHGMGNSIADEPTSSATTSVGVGASIGASAATRS